MIAFPQATAITFACIENIALIAGWMVVKILKKSDDEAFVKKQQYVENIMHEVLLYPNIIMLSVGWATEKMYTLPEGPWDWAEVRI